MASQNQINTDVLEAVRRIKERMGDTPDQKELRRATEPEITGNDEFDTELRSILNEIRATLPYPIEDPEDIDLDDYLEFMRTKH